MFKLSSFLRSLTSDSNKPIVQTGLMLALLVFASAAYLPGISGPWIFDDYSNLLQNSYVRISRIDLTSLSQAAFSLEAGPLQRPISMLSFALNHYFAGGFSNTISYKATNLIIHIVNGVLVFWLLVMVLTRIANLSARRNTTSPVTHRHVPIVAGGAALLWFVHPIQMTSVLYVVQRMTELSALFTLAGLVCYMAGRLRMVATANTRGMWLAALGPVGFGTLGVFSKESAALLPLFMALLEYFLFAGESPWRSWPRLPAKIRALILVACGFAVAWFVWWVIQHSLPRYSVRNFGMIERLLTEGRVLFLYLSLLVAPQINRFGHIHDDIEISRTLLDPWTTLPSLIGILALIGVGIATRRRHPLFSLGILWFFTAHLMESTVLPLEIAHEHRNYLASLGIVLVMAHLAGYAYAVTRNRAVLAAIPVLIVAFTFTTWLRATQWADYNTFFRYESSHHPNSARTQVGLSVLLESQGHQKEAMQALRRAAEIESFDAGFMLQMHVLAGKRGELLSADDQTETLRRLEHGPATAVTMVTLGTISACLPTRCIVLRDRAEEWVQAILRRPVVPDASFIYHLYGRVLLVQGRVSEAIGAFHRSHDLDRNYLHPLFELVALHIELGDFAEARRVLAELRQANGIALHPRSTEIRTITEELERREVEHQTGKKRDA